MNLINLPLRIAKLQYSAFRLPLDLLQRRVFTHLPEIAAIRRGFERALGALDDVAGQLFADQSIIRRGELLSRRGEFLEKAAKLESAAEGRREAAAEKRRAAQAHRRHTREQAQRRGQDEVTLARNQAQKHGAGLAAR